MGRVGESHPVESLRPWSFVGLVIPTTVKWFVCRDRFTLPESLKPSSKCIAWPRKDNNEVLYKQLVNCTKP